MPGFPDRTAWGGTRPDTTAPAPMTTPRPIPAPCRTSLFSQGQTSDPILTGRAIRHVGLSMPGRPCAQLVERVAGDGPGVMVAGHDRDRGHGGEATDLGVRPPLLHDVGATVGVVADIPPVELDALPEADTGQAGMRRFQHRYPRPSPTRSAHAVARRSSLERDHQRGAPTGNPWAAHGQPKRLSARRPGRSGWRSWRWRTAPASPAR